MLQPNCTFAFTYHYNFPLKTTKLYSYKPTIRRKQKVWDNFYLTFDKI